MAKIPYRPDIDGLRGIAVLAVVLFHANLGLYGGYVGVDVFFVISGYLITSLLIKEGQRGPISLSAFWVRRIRRLVPALVVLVVTVWLVATVLLLPGDLEELGRSMVWQVALSSNVFFWRESGYFAGAAEMKPLLHTWSLAIEEQFYVLLPGVIAIAFKYCRDWISAIIYTATILSFVGCVYGTSVAPSASFYLLPTRAWEMLIGAALACLTYGKGKVFILPNGLLANLASMMGLAAIGYAVIAYSRSTVFPGAAAAIPCLGAVVIIASSQSQLSWAGRMLAWEPIRQIGLGSYSIYLWHWPFFAFASYYGLMESLEYRVALMLAGVIAGFASYRWIEQTTRYSRFLKNNRNVYALAGTAFTAVLAVGLWTSAEGGFPGRVPEDVRSIAATAHERSPFRREMSVAEIERGEFSEFGMPSGTVFVWGDSHAMAILSGMDNYWGSLSGPGCAEKKGGLAATCSVTPPVLGYRYPVLHRGIGERGIAHNQAVFNFLRQDDRLKKVLLVAKWDEYLETDGFKEAFQETLLELNSIGKAVFVMVDVPLHPSPQPQAVALAKWWDCEADGATTRAKYLEQRNGFIRFVASCTGDFQLVDPIEVFFPDNQEYCRAMNGMSVLYRDDDHLSMGGSLLLAPIFDQLFQEGRSSMGAPANRSGE